MQNGHCTTDDDIMLGLFEHEFLPYTRVNLQLRQESLNVAILPSKTDTLL